MIKDIVILILCLLWLLLLFLTNEFNYQVSCISSSYDSLIITGFTSNIFLFGIGIGFIGVGIQINKILGEVKLKRSIKLR